MRKAWDDKDWDYLLRWRKEKTYQEIADDLGRTEKSIRRKLQRNGLSKRDFIQGYKHDYFNTWSASSAYILGFTMADGYINYRPNLRYALEFLINEKDIEILEFIKSEISPNSNIATQTYKDRDSIHKSLRLNSKELVTSLVKMGFQRNKTGNEFIPPIPREFHWDFIRGLFDGDGCIYTGNIWHGQMNKYYYVGKAYICCSSVEFLKSVQLIGGNIGRINKKHSQDNFYLWNIAAKDELKYFADSMYYDGHPFSLERKRKKFEEFFGTNGLCGTISPATQDYNWIS